MKKLIDFSNKLKPLINHVYGYRQDINDLLNSSKITPKFSGYGLSCYYDHILDYYVLNKMNISNFLLPIMPSSLLLSIYSFEKCKKWLSLKYVANKYDELEQSIDKKNLSLYSLSLINDYMKGENFIS